MFTVSIVRMLLNMSSLLVDSSLKEGRLEISLQTNSKLIERNEY